MKISYKENLGKTPDTKITRLDVFAPYIACQVRPGQFVVLMVSEEGERIPLTIVDKDEDKGTITLIFQEVGLTTKLLGKLNVGDSLYTLVGPLGHPTEIKNYGRVILVGGGVGIAEVYPVAEALKKTGNHITTILGSRTKELLILEDELRKISDELYITTDDGSYGRKGFVTDILQEILNYEPRPPEILAGPPCIVAETTNYELIYAVGPIPMMRKVSLITKAPNTKTIVSLNALMVDATGMCGCCRVSVGGETKFSCVDGPEFDAHLVDWDELEKRTKVYLDKERHICEVFKNLLSEDL